MQFVFQPNSIDQFFQNAYQCRQPGQCARTGTAEKKWQHKINLTQIPTKPEDLNLKMEKDSNTLSISGKSEVTKETTGGLKLFSTHIWSKEIPLPENVDQATLNAKMTENILTISAELKKHEITIERTVSEPVQELAQERMD